MPAKKKKKSAKPKAKKIVKKPSKISKKAKKPAPSKKKTAAVKAKTAKTKNPPRRAEETVAGQVLGKVEDYFAHIDVIALTLKGPLSAGDTIRVKGHTTDLIQKVESMQIDHLPVSAAKTGDGVGIKVGGRCRKGDKVYKI